VLSLRRENERVLADERILGTGDFVQRVVSEADERIKYQLRDKDRREKARQLIEQTCKKEDVNPKELRMGSRRGRIARLRAEIAYQLVQRYGFPLADVARQLGVTTSAISKAISRLSRT
jgi:DNA-binding MarR family transcriptional regulator